MDTKATDIKKKANQTMVRQTETSSSAKSKIKQFYLLPCCRAASAATVLILFRTVKMKTQLLQLEQYFKENKLSYDYCIGCL